MMNFLSVYSRSIRTVVLFCFVFLTCSCNNSRVKSSIEKMKSAPVVIDTDEMVVLSSLDDSIENKCWRWVIYNDTTMCKPCLMGHISDWDKIRGMRHVDCVFVFSVKSHEVDDYVKAYIKTGVDANVYLDTAGVFLRDNPTVTQDVRFHKFLIDENRNVLIVGNPLNNEKIMSMFQNAYSEKKMGTMQ